MESGFIFPHISITRFNLYYWLSGTRDIRLDIQELIMNDLPYKKEGNCMKNKTKLHFFHWCAVIVLVTMLLPLSGCQLLKKYNSTEVAPTMKHTFFKMKVGSNEIMIDDETIKLDSVIREIDGTTYVPLRFLTEHLGAQSLQYDAATEEISFILPSLKEPNEVEPTK